MADKKELQEMVERIVEHKVKEKSEYEQRKYNRKVEIQEVKDYLQTLMFEDLKENSNYFDWKNWHANQLNLVDAQLRINTKY